MNNKSSVLGFFALGLLVFCLTGLAGCGLTSKPYLGAFQGAGRAPIIKNAHGPERARFGDVLRIYIEAEDPDRDMLRIAAVVEQPGVGSYPTDWIYLNKSHEGSFKGYLQWNTSSSKAVRLSEWTYITLKISVFDRAGNESNVVAFPIEFGMGRFPTAPVPSVFETPGLPRIGYISVDLYDPALTDRGDRQREWDLP